MHPLEILTLCLATWAVPEEWCLRGWAGVGWDPGGRFPNAVSYAFSYAASSSFLENILKSF